ncbi:Lysine exporter protein (LYSE/YGGA) [Methanohalobium evestigatum Z-7303]|uniref:Lysine exporter protein (LYSE/YGGA) n=1 Tax=Methanohalobium evestigatum (strain ATCC BAA-1072 / DSM 3721 / NBRC 107634 / OCM 161 / Z-7303) TaxID=644295 RepID=D7E6N3_METEZ|nr:LysE family transporter [Methanohalobium evestigatum]ADI73255.1 Lysine exporter protein (LYSE/YGGA) [Methanohalobium evestigatum Z-7303]
MLETFEMLLIGLGVGFTGAVVPGPMLFATIETSFKKGWSAGPEVVLGHALIESVITLLIIFGISSFINDDIFSIISVVGGIALVVFGIFTVKSPVNDQYSCSNSYEMLTSPIVSGVVTSASNPYFWMWWFTAGSALVLRGYEIGLIAAVFFIAGHWIADLGWYSAVSLSFSRGKKLISSGMHNWMMKICGVFLILFGLWFVIGWS